MTHRFPRNFTLIKAAVLAVLIAATQFVPQSALSGDGASPHMPAGAKMWSAAMDALDCPVTGENGSDDQLI